ncbi:hypothetical protein [Mesorhizobium sp. KR2-14]|uniref:hypothetical protein n=1 Tax=Mesorhizobium sp. KR2-14 TaxID=3156610 RepID=UPI0032B597D3
MAARLSGKEIFIGAASSASVALLAVVVAFLLTQASTLGTHGEKLSQIENSIARMETNLGARFDAVEAKLDRIKVQMEAREIDLPVLLARMGMVEKNEVFSAAILDDAVWLFSSDEKVAERLINSGMRRERVNETLFGFRVMPASLLQDGVHVEPAAQTAK